jgi:uncharacterized membrane protein
VESGKTMSDPTDRLEEHFEQPVFAAVIRPHRSLGRDGFRIVMTLCCLASVVASIPFLVLGFWPVAGLFGLDFLALYIAFRVNFRSGESFEELTLTPIQLLVRKVTPRGRASEWRFNPLWTRLDREDDDEYGLQTLSLSSRGQHVVIARDLSPPERETLAEALGRALSDVRRGY